MRSKIVDDMARIILPNLKKSDFTRVAAELGTLNQKIARLLNLTGNL